MPPVAAANIAHRTYCNAAGIRQTFDTQSVEAAVTRGTESCFHWDTSVSGGFSVTTSAEISGSIPGVADASASASRTAHFELSHKFGGKNCDSSTTTKTETIQFPTVTLPSHTAETYTFSQFQGKLDGLKYTATLDQHFADGTTKTTQISGTYRGVSYSSITQKYENYRENVHSCSGAFGTMLLAGTNATLISSAAVPDGAAEANSSAATALYP